MRQEHMDFETYVRATLECHFSNCKDELIDSACKIICDYKGNKDNVFKYYDRLYKEVCGLLKTNMRIDPGLSTPEYKEGLNDGFVTVMLKMDRLFKEMTEEDNNEH